MTPLGMFVSRQTSAPVSESRKIVRSLAHVTPPFVLTVIRSSGLTRPRLRSVFSPWSFNGGS